MIRFTHAANTAIHGSTKVDGNIFLKINILSDRIDF